jgi:mono/diheme cytochrome c family protein
MRRLAAALAISLAFTACSRVDSDLPPAYRRIPVPEERLRSPEARARGKALFITNCALCHGERGDGRGQRGSGFAKPPASFIDPAWRNRATPRRVFFAIREGLRGTPMPAWDWLSEEEAWDLVAYVLSLRSAVGDTGGFKARPVPGRA